MPIDYGQIMRAQAAQIDSQQALAVAELETARITEDGDGANYAAQRILELDSMRAALDSRARQYLAGQAAQSQGNRFGLSQDEQDIANGSFSDLPQEERQRIYAENKARYQHARATGAYRDDQGSVRR